MVGPDKKTVIKNKNAPKILPFSKKARGNVFIPLLVKTKDKKTDKRNTPIKTEKVFL